jgi:hypothetical protein
MKTWIHLPTGKRYPEWGYGNYLEIRDGQVLRLNRKKQKAKDWQFEEIPDLRDKTKRQYIERHNRQDCKDFREYAAKYGVEVAQEFLSCADICKYTFSHHIMNPRFTDEQEDWFEKTFEATLDSMLESLSWVLGRQSLDVLKLEKLLAEKYGYTGLNYQNAGQSMVQFIDLKWGKGTADKVKELF